MVMVRVRFSLQEMNVSLYNVPKIDLSKHVCVFYVFIILWGQNSVHIIITPHNTSEVKDLGLRCSGYGQGYSIN